MNQNNDGVWLDELLAERLKGSEKLLRNVFNLADELFLRVDIRKYPLMMERKQYCLYLCKIDNKEKKWKAIWKLEDMELEVLLKKTDKYLRDYRDKHKEYNLQKPGGGVMI